MRATLRFIVMVPFLLAVPLLAQAAVAVDAVGPSSAGTSCNNCSTLSWSHTVSGSNTLLIVGVADGSIDSDTLTATYNSVSMTSLGEVHTNNSTSGFIQVFYLVNPASGAHTVQISGISANAGVGAVGGSVSFTGVNQTTPFINTATNAGNSATASLNVTSVSGDMVFTAAADGETMSSPNQTSQWLDNVNTASGAGNAGMQTANGTGSAVSFTYTTTNADFWGMIGADIQAATGGGSGGTFRIIRLMGGVRLKGGVRFR